MRGIVLVLVAAVLWGVGSLFSKVAVATVDPWTAAAVRSAVFFPIVAVFVLRRTRVSWGADRVTLYGVGAGLATGVTILSARVALTAYDVSLVSPVRRLSLLVTVAVAVTAFGESLTVRKLCGVGAALGGALLLSV